jgi:Leucine-rich repeat (LRR) protein
MEKIKKLFEEHKQPFIAGGLALLALLAFGVFQLVEYIRFGSMDDAERYFDLAERHHISGNYRRAEIYYGLTLEANPQFVDGYVAFYEFHIGTGERRKARDLLILGVENTGSDRLRALLADADYEIVWVSREFERSVRRTYELGNDEVWRSDLDEITDVHWMRNFGTDFSDLRHFRVLQRFSVEGISVSSLTGSEARPFPDIKILSEFTALTSLSLAMCMIDNLDFLLPLVNLEYLSLNDNNITDISPLAALPKLTFLNFANNAVEDLRPLGDFPALTNVNVGGNPFRHLGLRELSRITTVSGLPGFLPADDDDFYIFDWADDFIRSTIERVLRSNDGYIPNSKLSEITELTLRLRSGSWTINQNAITDYSDLARLPNLAKLSIYHADNLDFELLASLELASLDISNCSIGDLTPLAAFTSLEELRLDDNQITDLSPLSGLSSLRLLQINRNQVTDISPVLALENLVSFSFPDNLVSDINPLGSLPSLDHANFMRNPIQNFDFFALSHITTILGLPNLRPVDENDYYVWDWRSEIVRDAVYDSLWIHDGFVTRSALNNLSWLSMHFVGSGDADVDFSDLLMLPNLSSLVISHYGGDLSLLGNLTNLTSLSLNRCDLNDSAFLSHLTNLTSLNFSESTSDALVIENLPALSNLNLWNNTIESLTLSALPSLTYVYISGDSGYIDTITASGLTSFENLHVNGIDRRTFAALSEFRDITSLHVFGPRINDISPLSELTNLSSLSLSNLVIRDLNALSNLASLETLTIYDSAGVIEDFSALSQLVNLTALNMGTTNPNEYARYIADLPKLETLTLGSWGHTFEFSLSLISGISSLKHLSLNSDGVTDIDSLSHLVNLESLSFNYSSVVFVVFDLEPFAGLTKLTSLNLNSKGITDLSPLANLTNLTTLNLGGNRITDLSPLANLANLTTLNLGDNRITDLSPLSGLRNLESLNLSSNRISDFSPLAGLENLITLNTWGNETEDLSAIQHILDAIEEYWMRIWEEGGHWY